MSQIGGVLCALPAKAPRNGGRICPLGVFGWLAFSEPGDRFFIKI
jgi:hypothetical protein